MLDRRSRRDDAPEQRRRVRVALFIVAADEQESRLLKSAHHVAERDEIRHIGNSEIAPRTSSKQLFEQRRERGWSMPMVLEIDPRQSTDLTTMLRMEFFEEASTESKFSRIAKDLFKSELNGQPMFVLPGAVGL